MTCYQLLPRYQLMPLYWLIDCHPYFGEEEPEAQILADLWQRRSSSPSCVHFPCFIFLASVFPVCHFGSFISHVVKKKSLLLPSLAYPLFSHHFRPPLPTLRRSFPSPEGIHLTIKDTEGAWTGLYIPEMPAWPWNAAELLGKGPKGPVLSQACLLHPFFVLIY